MTALRVAIVGLGKIARDQHIPAIAGTDGVTLVAIASPHDSLPDLPHFATLDELLRDGPPIDAVAEAICLDCAPLALARCAESACDWRAAASSWIAESLIVVHVPPLAVVVSRPTPPVEEMLPALITAMFALLVVTANPLKAPVTAIDEDALTTVATVSAELLSLLEIVRPTPALSEMVAPDSR